MMDIELLRDTCYCGSLNGGVCLACRAADEIERLHELEGTVRILSAAQTTLIAERESLRAFCRAIMHEWPNSCVDGFDMQVAAAKCGLLIEATVTEPCCEDCACREYYDLEEFAKGIKCYKLADWLNDQ